MIIKRMAVSILFPLALLGVVAYTHTFFQGTDRFSFATLSGVLMHILYWWPLKLLMLTGAFGNDADGFYSQWWQVSMAFSVVCQMVILFLVYHPEDEEA